jgi:hypothetical protein
LFATSRIKVLVIALVLIVSPVFSGCSGEPAVTPPDSMTIPPEELTVPDIAENAIYASTTIDTASFEIYTEFTVAVIGGRQPGIVTVAQDTTGYVNNVSREMEFTMNIATDIPGTDKGNTSLEMYFVDKWAYMKTDIPPLGEQWIKMELSDELWAEQSQLAQQAEFLKTAAGITLAGNDSVNGVDCYILDIIPDMEMLAHWVLSQSDPQQSGIEISEQDFAGRIKTVSQKEWVAKDSFLPMREDFDVYIELLPEDFSNPVSGLEKTTMDISTQVLYFDYGKIVPVELPPEAVDAPEVPAG